MTQQIQEILATRNKEKILPLFKFNLAESNEVILFKFGLWARHFFPQYFKAEDAAFHNEIDEGNLNVYRAVRLSFVDIAFRGAAKTARTKLFIAFVILNDIDNFRKYFKILCADIDNSKQLVTDIYNMLVNEQVQQFYPDTFKQTNAKREETMESFTTFKGVKLVADTVGVGQRGALQEDARPDFIWFDDFETRKTLYSAKESKKIWDNMEEARTGLAKSGGCIYTCNYISELGNVHTLVQKQSQSRPVLIVPIIKEGVPTWSYYTVADINQMREDDDDFEGERLCKPSASKDVLFDRSKLDKAVPMEPKKVSGGFKMFYLFNPAHRYGSGHDVSGGVGLDSSTSVFLDFSTIPAQVVGTFESNITKPDIFGDEVNRESDMYGGSIAGIEKNNHGHATIGRAKQLETNMYYTRPKDTKVLANTQADSAKEYGWHTNALTKPKMVFEFLKAVDDGLVELNDPALIAEAKNFSRNDLMDAESDPRLTTRHFDLLIAAMIAWQMKDYAEVALEKDADLQESLPDEPLYPDIGL